MTTNILQKFSLFVIVLTSGIVASGQKVTGPSNTILLASLDNNEKKTESALITQEATAVFPDILSGNESESADYIEKFSKNRRQYLIRTYKKGKSFFSKASAILKKHQLPQELNVLLALESGFNGNAVSCAGAVGYWQIMDETAKEYGLKIVQQQVAKKEKTKAGKAIKLSADSLKKIKKLQSKDDRRNFNKSTYAAAKYLRDRSRNLNNDWLLVVASYNCGVGNVWEAMAKSGKVNPSFWDVKSLLPAETQAYVMNFIALNVVFNNYEKFAENSLTFKPTQIKAEPAEEILGEILSEESSGTMKD